MNKETIAEKEANIRSTERLEAFSDGVFAIAITLLILDIHIPEFKENETLMHTLSHEWPGLLALLIGFFTILICWINHHYMFTLIERCNSKLLLLNGFKLLVVTTTPLATALLSKHFQDDWIGCAINIYAFNFALMGIAMSGVWHYANAMGFAKASPEVLSATSRLYIFSTLAPLSIWIISFFSITGCLILSGIMFAFYIFPEKVVARQIGK